MDWTKLEAAAAASRPCPFDLTDEAERARLLRETLGYATVSINRKDGTDRPGREFARDALKHALMMGYRLVPADGSAADVVTASLAKKDAEIAQLRRVVQMVSDEYYGDDSSGDWQSIAREARAALDAR